MDLSPKMTVQYQSIVGLTIENEDGIPIVVYDYPPGRPLYCIRTLKDGVEIGRDTLTIIFGDTTVEVELSDNWKDEP